MKSFNVTSTVVSIRWPLQLEILVLKFELLMVLTASHRVCPGQWIQHEPHSSIGKKWVIMKNHRKIENPMELSPVLFTVFPKWGTRRQTTIRSWPSFCSYHLQYPFGPQRVGWGGPISCGAAQWTAERLLPRCPAAKKQPRAATPQPFGRPRNSAWSGGNQTPCAAVVQIVAKLETLRCHMFAVYYLCCLIPNISWRDLRMSLRNSLKYGTKLYPSKWLKAGKTYPHTKHIWVWYGSSHCGNIVPHKWNGTVSNRINPIPLQERYCFFLMLHDVAVWFWDRKANLYTHKRHECQWVFVHWGLQRSSTSCSQRRHYRQFVSLNVGSSHSSKGKQRRLRSQFLSPNLGLQRSSTSYSQRRHYPPFVSLNVGSSRSSKKSKQRRPWSQFLSPNLGLSGWSRSCSQRRLHSQCASLKMGWWHATRICSFWKHHSQYESHHPGSSRQTTPLGGSRTPRRWHTRSLAS